MSLSSLLESGEVRRRFGETFPKPPMNATPGLVAPSRTERPGHFGTAFDYLFRFTLRRLNPDTVRGERWTAEVATRLLTGSRLEEARATIRRSKAARNHYVTSGEVTRSLLEDCLELARLDIVARTRGQYDIGKIDAIRPEDVDDLRQLHEAIPVERLRSETLCLLNPTFGKASRLVGGADADVFIDDLLLDIKTVQDATFSRDMLNQLVGYYTLHVMGGIGGLDPKPSIRRVGIYFSRHAHLYIVNLEDVIDRSTYPDFVEWFARYCMAERLSSNRGG